MMTRSAIGGPIRLWTRRVARGMSDRGAGVSELGGVSDVRASIAAASASPKARQRRVARGRVLRERARARTASSRETRRGSAAENGSGGAELGSPIRLAIVSASLPGKARLAQIASKIVAASENWSLAGLNSARASASGALYAGVPRTEPAVRERRVAEAGDPEVGQLRAVRREDHVLRLHVAVDDPRLVRRRERRAELARHRPHRDDVDGPFADPLAQRGAGEVLEDEVEPDVGLFSHVVERDEVRVLDRRGGARLLAHPGEERATRLAGEAEIVAHDLDRDMATEDAVAREQDPPHSPLAEQADDLVAADVGDEVHRAGV